MEFGIFAMNCRGAPFSPTHKPGRKKGRERVLVVVLILLIILVMQLRFPVFVSEYVKLSYVMGIVKKFFTSLELAFSLLPFLQGADLATLLGSFQFPGNHCVTISHSLSRL